MNSAARCRGWTVLNATYLHLPPVRRRCPRAPHLPRRLGGGTRPIQIPTPVEQGWATATYHTVPRLCITVDTNAISSISNSMLVSAHQLNTLVNSRAGRQERRT